MTKRWITFLVWMAAAGCSGSSATSDDSADSGAASSDDGGGGGSSDNDAGASANGSDGGSGFGVSSDVSIIVEPNGNSASELVAAITGAKKSVYMTMYQIDDTAIINAIKGRESAGLDVKVVLDGSSTNKSSNTTAYNDFNNVHAGTAVWSNPTFTYTHEKCVIIDGTEAWIMTMNLNTSSPNDDREFLAIDDNAADVAEAQSIFLADYASTSISPTGNLVVANANARPDLVALINTATKSLDIEVEEFSDTDKNGIVAAVVAVAKRGVPVRVVIANASLDTTGPAAIADVKSAGGSVIMSGGTDGSSSSSNPYLAGKTILIDCATGTCAYGYVGSENLTANSLGHNRELGVIISTSSELSKIYTAVKSDAKNGTAQ